MYYGNLTVITSYTIRTISYPIFLIDKLILSHFFQRKIDNVLKGNIYNYKTHNYVIIICELNNLCDTETITTNHSKC